MKKLDPNQIEPTKHDSYYVYMYYVENLPVYVGIGHHQESALGDPKYQRARDISLHKNIRKAKHPKIRIDIVLNMVSKEVALAVEASLINILWPLCEMISDEAGLDNKTVGSSSKHYIDYSFEVSGIVKPRKTADG